MSYMSDGIIASTDLVSRVLKSAVSGNPPTYLPLLAPPAHRYTPQYP